MSDMSTNRPHRSARVAGVQPQPSRRPFARSGRRGTSGWRYQSGNSASDGSIRHVPPQRPQRRDDDGREHAMQVNRASVSVFMLCVGLQEIDQRPPLPQSPPFAHVVGEHLRGELHTSRGRALSSLLVLPQLAPGRDQFHILRPNVFPVSLAVLVGPSPAVVRPEATPSAIVPDVEGLHLPWKWLKLAHAPRHYSKPLTAPRRRYARCGNRCVPGAGRSDPHHTARTAVTQWKREHVRAITMISRHSDDAIPARRLHPAADTRRGRGRDFQCALCGGLDPPFFLLSYSFLPGHSPTDVVPLVVLLLLLLLHAASLLLRFLLLFFRPVPSLLPPARLLAFAAMPPTVPSVRPPYCLYRWSVGLATQSRPSRGCPVAALRADSDGVRCQAGSRRLSRRPRCAMASWHGWRSCRLRSHRGGYGAACRVLGFGPGRNFPVPLSRSTSARGTIQTLAPMRSARSVPALIRACTVFIETPSSVAASAVDRYSSGMYETIVNARVHRSILRGVDDTTYRHD
jgi:hypothetical protein